MPLIDVKLMIWPEPRSIMAKIPGHRSNSQQIHDHVDIVLHRLLFHRAKAHHARIVHKQIGCLAEGLEGGCNLLREVTSAFMPCIIGLTGRATRSAPKSKC